ncbi:hypothetical protein C1X75_02850 [Pseudomonas sp. FW305-17]|nr:hypothetical protein C1X79_00485 [Pseudomonas sp. FW305-42]PNA27610.1 hypothetical protein C1X78_02230 [Pseudomonas sp. MPR-R1B]PNB29672.1 hypothetical protein C1X80_00935 [Pseudomonas sp. DP16D-E2]PNB45228.1 hypothetical protein C1X75_02850 [Pseudomonas sp. FW305-17]PNB63597.1 hypothetical protein C1X77_06225 [Pseudomonas sp. GW531-E2]PNB69339.1 hypothetical protein C1X76_05200 [Pseudomonas sp. FW305-127]
MKLGLQTWNEDASPNLDTSNRLGTLLGSVVTGTRAGSLIVPELARGEPFYFFHPEVLPSRPPNFQLPYELIYPVVKLQGQTLSWSFPAFRYTGAYAQYGYSVSVKIIYGVF